MNVKMQVKGLDKVQSLFKNLKEKVKPEVIDKALDQTLQKDLEQLKAKLFAMINKDIKSQVTVQSQTLDEAIVNIQKSDEEIIKHITGVDLSKVSKTKDYNTLADGNLAVISNKNTGRNKIDPLSGNPTSRMSSGVNLRLPIGEGDTFENQYQMAINYYNNANFVFVDNNGKGNYYINPGIDMSRFVKVVCSRETGNGQVSNDKWDKHRDKRGFADWTLLSDGVNEVKNSFTNITDVIEKIKEGDYEEAKAILSKVSGGSLKTNQLIEKIDNLKERQNLTPSVEAYNNIVRLLKNMRIEKTVKADKTYYTLVSSYDENAPDFNNFQDKLIEEVKLWKISNEQRWVKTLVNSIVGLITRLLR